MERLDAALEHRLTAVVAGAGFGKTTLLAGWAAEVRSAWYTVTPEDAELGAFARGVVDSLRLRVPGLSADLAAGVSGARGPDSRGDAGSRADAFAAGLGDALRSRLVDDLALVVDDVHELDAAPIAARLLESLCRNAPPPLHLVLSSRTDVPFPIARLRGQGHVVELASADLAFDVAEVAELLEGAVGADAAELAPALHEATAGWPVAVRLAAETLASVPAEERAAALARIGSPGSALYEYLAAEVVGREPPEVRELVRTVAPFDSFTPALCEALGVEGAPDAVASLARRGLFLELHGAHVGSYALTGLLRDFAAQHLPVDPARARELHLRAAAWYEEEGRDAAALRVLRAVGAEPAIAAFLARRGEALLAAGAVDAVAAAIERLPGPDRPPALEQLLGEAQQLRGDWEAALGSFERATGDGEPSAALAWRIGLIHHLRGNLDEALAAYRRGRVDGAEPRDEALLLAWRASAHWLRGEADECRADAARGFEVATASAEPQALAAAHTALALVAALDGDRAANDAHYLRALDHAERAGDVLQLIRIRANRGSRHAEEGDYGAALAELDLADSLADVAGFASLRALVLGNRGDVKFRIGDLDEAAADLEAAKVLYQWAESRMVSYPLAKLGEVYRERGDLALARAVCEEAVARAEEAHDVQGLVPALAGLARVLAHEDPDTARELARRAVAHGPGMSYVQALLAAGWVAIERRELDDAAAAADDAAAAARVRRDLPGLAEALELAAAATGDRTVAAAHLDEALALWRGVGNALGVAWTELARAQVAERAEARELAERTARRFRELGARRGADAAEALLRELDRRERPFLQIRTLGVFGVVRAGEPVPPSEWQSKKARDLLKILLARRGRPVTREALMEALWPDGPVDKLGNRLSVALATLRAVLAADDDPAARQPLVADKSTVRLDLDATEVDVERFLAAAEAARTLRRDGPSPEATDLLERAEALNTGEFLEEDVYDDWSIALREEVRAVYVDLARALAEDAAARGAHDAACRYELRVLERDPYDEHAHLGLVASLSAAGRHGDARRRYRVYAAKMHEIGIEPAPFPSVRP